MKTGNNQRLSQPQFTLEIVLVQLLTRHSTKVSAAL